MLFTTKVDINKVHKVSTLYQPLLKNLLKIEPVSEKTYLNAKTWHHRWIIWLQSLIYFKQMLNIWAENIKKWQRYITLKFITAAFIKRDVKNFQLRFWRHFRIPCLNCNNRFSWHFNERKIYPNCLLIYRFIIPHVICPC